MRVPISRLRSQHLDDVYPTLERLIEAGDHARALREHPGWNVLHQLLEAETALVDAELDSHEPLKRAQYASLHGRRGGLTACLAAIHALTNHAESRFEKERAKFESGATPQGVQ